MHQEQYIAELQRENSKIGHNRSSFDCELPVKPFHSQPPSSVEITV